jgi:hypothetical protein
MKPERMILAAALLAILLPVGVAPVHAQGGDMQGRLEQELQRTDEVIQRVADMARDAGNAQAGELVRKALELQGRARQSFGSGRYAISASQTKLARELAQRALGLMLRPEERAERVELELQRTDDLIASAREDAGPDRPEPAAKLLDGAMRQQEQAWEYYRASQLRPALRLTLQVREQLRRLDHRMADAVPAQLRARLDRTEEIVRQASDEAAAAGERQRTAMAERARAMLARAREEFADGRTRPALQHMEQAERLARRALRNAGEEGPPDDLEAAMSRYQARAEQIQARLNDFPSAEASRLLQESREHFRLAHELTDRNGAPPDADVRERATAELRIAMRLLERAGELVQ